MNDKQIKILLLLLPLILVFALGIRYWEDLFEYFSVEEVGITQPDSVSTTESPKSAEPVVARPEHPDFPAAVVPIDCRVEKFAESESTRMYVLEEGVEPRIVPSEESGMSTTVALPVGMRLDLKGEKCGEWVSFSAYWAGDMATGWVKRNGLTAEPVDAEYFILRFKSTPAEMIDKRRGLIVRALKMEPNHTGVLTLFSEFLQQHGTEEERELVALRLSEFSSSVPETAVPGKNKDVSFGKRQYQSNQIYSLAPVSKPSRLTRAICRNGQMVSIKFEKSIARHDGEYASYIADSKSADFQDVCMLVQDDFLSTRVSLPLKQGSFDGCRSPFIQKSFEKGRRKVKNCWQMMSTNDEAVIQIEYESLWESKQATIAFIDKNRAIFYDERVVPQESGTSCWRIEDLCAFNPRSRIFSGVFKRGDIVEVLYLNAGSHGINGILMQSSGNQFFETAKEYLYAGAH